METKEFSTKSRVRGDFQARFCEKGRVKFPPTYSTRRILTYGGYFEAFMNTLKGKVQEKIQYGLLLLKTQDRLPKKYIQGGE